MALSIYLIGLRITLLSGKFLPPFYFGSIVVNFSVFASYVTARSYTFTGICMVMLVGIFF